MASPCDQASSASLKAKQERVRDNQRRSRARRQEYTIELEQRLEACRVTCREADLLRQSFHELQAENDRLRGLLHTAGVSPVLVDSFLHQRSSEPSSSKPNHPTTLRQLKPKISPHAMSINTSPTIDTEIDKITEPKPTRRAVSQTRTSSTPPSCYPEMTRSCSASELLRPDWESFNALDVSFLPVGSSSDVPPLPSPTTNEPLPSGWMFGSETGTNHSARAPIDATTLCWDSFAIGPDEYLFPDGTNNVASSNREG